MIKDMFIVILVLAVIVLGWLTFYGTPEDRASLSLVKDKIDTTREQLRDAYEGARKVTEPGVENSPLDKNRETGTATDQSPAQATTEAKKGKRVPDERKETQGEQQTGSSAEDVLDNIKPKKSGNSELLTGEELSAILGVLKSAQDVLRKTSFATHENSRRASSSEDETERATNENPQITIIKKKLSTGPVESE